MRFFPYAIHIIGILACAGCAGGEPGTPAADTSLNTISPTGTQKSKKGYMQEHYDRWVTEEWAPVTSEKKDDLTHSKQSDTAAAATPQKRADDAKDSDGALQKYVDKWSHYLQTQEKKGENTPSHVEALDKMPVIGK